MPPIARAKFYPSRCFALTLIVTLCLILLGCASKSADKVEVMKEQMDWMQSQFREHDTLVKDLRTQISALRAENRELRKKVATVTKVPKVPMVKLTPPEVEEGMENRVVEEPLEEEESVSTSDHAEMHWYFEGSRAYTAGDYDKAVVSLRKFLQAVPEHVYADRAQYWLVQTHFSNKEYAEALVQANRMVSTYPHSFRLPEVMVIRANAMLKLGQSSDGRLMLREFLKRFPNHELSDTVSRRLAEVSPFKAAPPLMGDEVQR